jgi:peptidoglycan/LPS O-acetylase OafA/YrhL
LNAAKSSRMGHIDSIRGIAAMLVAIRHFSDGYVVTMPAAKANETFLYKIATQLEFGLLGVIAFFAISGFVICPTLRGLKYDGARKFLISRFFRLYPAFWMSILLVLLTRHYLHGIDHDLPQVLGNLTMLYSFFHVEPIQGLYWTLEVELIFYLLCLTLLLCGWLHKPLILFSVGMGLMAVSQWVLNRDDVVREIQLAMGPTWAHLPLNLAIMCWGGLFRIWYDDRKRTCAIGSYKLPILILLIALLSAILWRPTIAIYTFYSLGNIDQIHFMIPYFLGLGLFIAGAIYIKLNNRFLVWLGTISFSLYLLHPIAYGFVGLAIKPRYLNLENLHLITFASICMVVAIIIAALGYYCVEKPAIKIGRYLQG